MKRRCAAKIFPVSFQHTYIPCTPYRPRCACYYYWPDDFLLFQPAANGWLFSLFHWRHSHRASHSLTLIIPLAIHSRDIHIARHHVHDDSVRIHVYIIRAYTRKAAPFARRFRIEKRRSIAVLVILFYTSYGSRNYRLFLIPFFHYSMHLWCIWRYVNTRKRVGLAIRNPFSYIHNISLHSPRIYRIKIFIPTVVKKKNFNYSLSEIYWSIYY